MSTSKPSLSGDFESAAQTMLTALEKAGAELNRNVNQCVEQLSGHCFALQKSLDDQLYQVRERYQSFVEVNLEQLEEHKDKLVKRLVDFEQSQNDTIVESGNALRQSLQDYADQVLSKLSQKLEQELSAVKEASGKDIARDAEAALPALKSIAEEGKGRLSQGAAAGEDAVSRKTLDLEQELDGLVAKWKEAIEAKVSAAQLQLNTATAEALESFDRMVEQALGQMLKSSELGATTLDESVSNGIALTDGLLQGFRERVANLSEAFAKSLEKQRQLSEEDTILRQSHSLSLAGQEIAKLSSESQEKIETAHQTFQRSLERMEHDYARQITGLIGSFEAALAEVGARGSGTGLQARAGSDWQEKLEKQLTNRGVEVLKGVRKLSQQLEDECLKSGQGMQERIEGIREDTLAVMEKQLQMLKADNDRSLKKFLETLAAMESHLQQVEEAGKAAAVTVMAYRSAHLSLGGE